MTGIMLRLEGAGRVLPINCGRNACLLINLTKPIYHVAMR